MKGAIAELCANTIRPPKMNSTSSIGVNHHHLLFQKNEKSSPTMPVRLARSSKNRIAASLHVMLQRRLFYHVISQNKSIHPTSIERIESFLGSVHDRLPFQIEGSVQHDGHSRGLAERLDQSIIFRIEFLPYRLQPARAVHMRDCRNSVSLAFFHVHDIEHETSGIVSCRVFQHEVVLSLLG